METIKCYTDGSATVKGENAGKSGFGVYFPNLRGKRRVFSLGFKNGLTGQMEVCALLFAIRAMPLTSKEKIKLNVFSDSEYVVKTFTENRLKKWVLNGWQNSSGIVKNKELWILIKSALDSRPFLILEMTHIRSHQVEKEKDLSKKQLLLMDDDIIGNMMADKFASYKRHKNLLNDITEINHRKSTY